MCQTTDVYPSYTNQEKMTSSPEFVVGFKRLQFAIVDPNDEYFGLV